MCVCSAPTSAHTICKMLVHGPQKGLHSWQDPRSDGCHKCQLMKENGDWALRLQRPCQQTFSSYNEYLERYIRDFYTGQKNRLGFICFHAMVISYSINIIYQQSLVTYNLEFIDCVLHCTDYFVISILRQFGYKCEN